MTLYPPRKVPLSFSASPTYAPAWWESFVLNGLAPAVVLDFVHNRYYDGVSAGASLSSLVGGSPAVSASGLALNDTNLPAAGRLLTAVQSAGVSYLLETVGFVEPTATGYGIIGYGSGAPDGFIQQSNNIAAITAATTGWNGNPTGWTAGKVDWSGTVVFSASHGAAGVFCGAGQNGLAVGVGCDNLGGHSSDTGADYPAASGGFSAVTSMKLGSWSNSFTPGGFMRLMAVYSTQVAPKWLHAPTVQASILSGLSPSSWVRPFSGNYSIFSGRHNFHHIDAGGGGSLKINCVNTACSAIVAAKIQALPPVGNAGVFFTNVTVAPWTGWEFWIDPNGALRVRMMGGWDGSSTGAGSGLLGVVGTTNICDNQWHVLAFTYDGSGAAAGVTMYIDGAVETASVESDGLVTSTAGTGVGNMIVANQYRTDFGLQGWMDSVVLSNTQRSGGYVAAHASAGTAVPPVDGSTILSYSFDEGSGSSTVDASGNGNNGTMDKGMWY